MTSNAMEGAAGTRSPSDLCHCADGLTKLGGRLQSRAGTALTVGDAWCSVTVELAEPTTAELGDLLLIEGEVLDGRLARARVLERHACGRPTGPSSRRVGHDEARFSLGAARALSARADALAAVRRFFAERRFIEVDSAQMVAAPGLDVHVDAWAIADASSPLHLITSPEYQMKRLLVAGIPRIYQLGHCFRRGELGIWHEPEFTMLEWYRAWCSAEEMMDETEALVRSVVSDVAGFAERTVAGRRVDFRHPFERLPVATAFERFARINEADALALAQDDQETFFRVLVDQVEPALGKLGHAVFLVDYPASQASLARLKPSDPRVCERFELYVAGLELCNGFGELTDPVEQRRRFELDQRRRAELAKPVYPIGERFLSALHEGMPPSAGNALGFDRLLAVCLEADAISEVIPFPHAEL